MSLVCPMKEISVHEGDLDIGRMNKDEFLQYLSVKDNW